VWVNHFAQQPAAKAGNHPGWTATYPVARWFVSHRFLVRRGSARPRCSVASPGVGKSLQKGFVVPSRSFSTAANRTTPFAKLKTRLRSDFALRSPGWALLPLRAFLGATFLYAGLSKIFDRQYLAHTS
jgi:hypothetical protein